MDRKIIIAKTLEKVADLDRKALRNLMTELKFQDNYKKKKKPAGLWRNKNKFILNFWFISVNNSTDFSVYTVVYSFVTRRVI